MAMWYVGGRAVYLGLPVLFNEWAALLGYFIIIARIVMILFPGKVSFPHRL